MGITGLLPYLKKASSQANIKDFKGSTVAVDSYCWLHRGAFACAEKLAMGEKTDQYVYYCMKYVNFMLSHDIKPIMVFDGCHLPSKKEVEKTRRERREGYRKKAAQFLREGKRSEARDCLTKCVDITPHMALELMNACRAKGVDCIVAPYEADAQLAYLAKIGVAQVVITEDSDLVLFGCEKVMFKMDFHGNGVLIEKKNLNVAMDLKADSYTFDKFRYMCMLSGCDYLQSLPGIGLGKANKLFRLSRQSDMNLLLKKMPSTLNMSNLVVPEEYVAGFQRADRTFLYQLVYDPLNRELVPLNPYPPEVDPKELDYAGPYIESERALQIALGNIDIYTGKKIGDFDPETYKPKSQKWDKNKDMLCMQSIWTRNYRPMSKIASSQKQNTLLSHMTSTSTRGKEVTIKTKLKVVPRKSPSKRAREEQAAENEMLSSYQTEDPDFQPIKRMKPGPNVSMQDALEQTERTATPAGRKREKCISESEVELKSPDNKAKSPRNVFAVGSDKSKKRFSLNSSRKSLELGINVETKSRFFKEEKPLQQTEFYKELDKGHNVSVKDEEDYSDNNGEIDEETGERSQNDASTGEADCRKSVETVSMTDNTAKDSRSSPYGSFSFSRKSSSSTLDKFKSSFDKESRRSSDSSKPFKPVVPNKELPRVESSSSLSLTCNAGDSGDVNHNTQCSNGDGDYMSVSQRTNLYSFDSYSQIDMDFDASSTVSDLQSQGASQVNSQNSSLYFSETAKTERTPQNSFSKVSSSKSKTMTSFYQGISVSEKSTKVDTVQESTVDVQIVSESLKSPDSSSSFSSSISAGSSKSLSGCRTSGLSKTAKKKGSIPGNENQPGITSFFSKYHFTKSSSEKLPANKKALSPRNDNGQT